MSKFISYPKNKIHFLEINTLKKSNLQHLWQPMLSCKISNADIIYLLKKYFGIELIAIIIIITLCVIFSAILWSAGHFICNIIFFICKQKYLFEKTCQRYKILLINVNLR
jgi:hypothetical protein